MENENQTAMALQESKESYFDGGFFQWLGWTILGVIVTSITFGICYPFAVCWKYEWEANHTVIDGRRLKFTGGAGGLFGTWLLCLALMIVTFGIYGFWVPIKIQKWREANTFFEDEITAHDSAQKLKFEKASYFDGGVAQWVGWSLLGWLVTFFTLGICYPWSVQMLYSWQQRHKVYCKKRCTFDGTATGLFGTWVVCFLLTIVTLGIYGLWIPIRIKKWQIKHTHLLEDETAAEEQEETSFLQNSLIGRHLLYSIGAFVVIIACFLPLNREGDSIIRTIVLCMCDYGWHIEAGAVLALIGAIAGILAPFVHQEKASAIALTSLIISVIGGVPALAVYSSFGIRIGFLLIIIGWIVAALGWWQTAKGIKE